MTSYHEREEGSNIRRRPDKDWTKGSVARNLWVLSLPIVVTQGLAILGPFVDMVWIGKLGAVSIAGVGVAGLVIQASRTVMIGLPTGMRALIARSIGAGDAESANHVAQQAFAITAAFAVILALVGLILSEQILNSFGLKAEVVATGVPYIRIMFIGASAMAFLQMMSGIMQASGDTVTPMRIAITYRLAHVVMDPFLILGWWVFPRLGVVGAAVANIITDAIGLALTSWYLFSGRTRLQFTMRGFRCDWNIIWRMLKIGIPASLNGLERISLNLILMRMMVPFGTIAVAAKSLIPQIEGPFVRMVNISFGRGAGVLAAQNLGAGQPERAEKSGWLAAGYVQAYNFAFMAVILLWPEWVIGIFSPNPELVAVGSIFLRITAVGFIMHSIHCIIPACINDVGDTIPPMVVTLVSSFLVAVPIAYFLPRVTDLGGSGIMWAEVASLYFSALVLATYFRVGRWKHKRI